MHPRQASLIQKAASLYRKAYQALPWGVRIADILYHLASDAQADVGRSLYTFFIMRGVTDLPDIKGQPALSFPVDLKRNKMAPPGYGKEYGHRLWRRVLGMVKNPAVAQDVIFTVIAKLLKHPEHLNEGSTLKQAEAFVIRACENAIKDYWRAQKRHREDSLYGQGDEGEEIEFSMLDPKTVEQLDDVLLPGEWAKAKQIADRKVHPDASLWLDLMKDGYNSKEIVGDKTKGIPSMLPHVQKKPMVYQNWESNIKPKIFQVFQEVLGDRR